MRRPAYTADEPEYVVATAAVHATRESNFEVAVYLKMTRKKNTEKSRTSRHASSGLHRR